jgi:hypothetical protein
VLCVPLTDSVPAHAPEAVQEVAFVEDQVNVDIPPLATLVGLALKETLGGVDETVTVVDCVAEPPLPVHVSVNFVVLVRAGVTVEPLVGSPPLQPPEAVQEVALVANQVNVELPPLATVLGLAANVTVGVGEVTETVAD